MKEFDFEEFDKNIQNDFLIARSIMGEIEKIEWNEMHSYYEQPYYDEENELNKFKLIERLEQIRLKLEFAYEYIGLSKMYDKLQSELDSHKGKFDHLDFLPYVDVFYSPVELILQNHLNALTSHIPLESKSEYQDASSTILLEQILRGTPKMISDRKIEPSNEAEVRAEVYNTLIHVFPDTVREIPISKVFKTFKPDIGIKHLKCAIEYKFVDSDSELKNALGGMFEDIHGYEGSDDWTTFYAVIYMTDNFYTQAQVDAEFKLSKVPPNWKPIVLFGKGKRKKK